MTVMIVAIVVAVAIPVSASWILVCINTLPSYRNYLADIHRALSYHMTFLGDSESHGLRLRLAGKHTSQHNTCKQRCRDQLYSAINFHSKVFAFHKSPSV
jgi:hypothetical protein